MGFRSYYLAQALKNKEVKTTVFTSSYSHVMHTLPKVTSSFESQNIGGIEYVWVKTSKYKASKSIGRLWNMIYFSLKLLFYPFYLKDKPHTILVSSPSPFPILNGWLWAKLTRAKLIFEVRDIWPLSITELGGVSLYHPLILLIKIIEKFAYKVSNYTISVLPHADKHMIPSGLNPEKFRYIPNGVLIESEFSKEDCSLALPKGKFIVGYVGTIGIANHLKLLLDVAQLIDDIEIHFVLVGQGDMKDNLIDYCQDHGIENVTFFDSVPRSQVPNILKKIDVCYIALQNKEIFSYGVSPNKLFDYMFSKKPVVFCINSGNTPVNDAKCGYEIRSGKPKEIVNAILKIKSLPHEERRKMGENGYRYVCENHSYEKLAKKYLELI